MERIMTIFRLMSQCIIATVVCLFLLIQAWPCLAIDTDIYKTSVKQNAYILLDNSGSMAWPVYENSIDYAAMYDYLYAKSNITDTVNRSHYDRNKVYMVRGDNSLKVALVQVAGQDRPFTGDAGNPGIRWHSDGYDASNPLVDLHVVIGGDGNLSPESGQMARLALNATGDEVLLDGVSLPLGQGRAPHKFSTLFDGSQIDEGLVGLLKAPGYYFSGLEWVGSNATNHNRVEDQDDGLYFIVTGNWLNLQQVLNLYYTSGGGTVWENETFPIEVGAWSVTDRVMDYPLGSADYSPGLRNNGNNPFVTQVGADQIQVHFSMFDVDATDEIIRTCRGKKCSDTNVGPDYVVLYDEHNNEVARYNNDNSPQGQWSPIIPGDTVRFVLISNNDSNVGKGYTVDKYRTADDSGTYTLQSRLEIAQEALVDVVDEMRGKINWGFATFKNGDGASIRVPLNPTDNDDTNRQSIVTQVNGVSAGGGTPLGEALQDVFDDGYFGHRNSLQNLSCRKNYVIVVSDGFPSLDTDWGRIGGIDRFTDLDLDGFTADPAQSDDPNYYDDVAHWMYTHSWIDKTEVDDPVNSFENVISHQIGFGLDHALMRDAAEEAGGQYITAYNKTQLVNAFYSLALRISEAISFTAPVVSVDAANKVQNGDDLYMGQFLPMDATYWPGNLKKFVLGDGSASRPDRWMIYDGDDQEAIDSNGLFLDNTTGFWGDESDANDKDNYGAPDIKEDGVGEVLTEQVISNFNSGNYYARNIKTYLSGSLVDFNRSTIGPADLGLGDTATRDKVVNWTYGYTFDADATTGDPVAARDWALGAIVHSRPTVIDYYNASDFSKIDKRYVVAGADDGMLHVFDDTSGAEVLAFIPSDALGKLKNFETLLHQPLVDGTIKLYRENGNPKYLIFGLRRGGARFWALNVSDSNPANWTVAWSFADSDMVQSWSDVEIAKVRTGPNTFTNVAIFSGGYDPEEDNFPEPFLDSDNNGTPYASNGNIDVQEWKSSSSSQDVYDNNKYDKKNPVADNHGRAIYVVNVATGVVVFSVRHGETDSPAKGEASVLTTHTRTDFNYCFPASPSVVTLSQAYSYDNSGKPVPARMSNVLGAIYAPDIYGNLFRITCDYIDGTPTWQVRHLFSVNPDSSSDSGELRQGDSSTNQGRKVFYGPAVSWRGSGRFFDASNYYYPHTTFNGTDAIASLFFGTGDREHPSYQMVQDRVYAVYDDLPVTATNSVLVNSAPYTEDDLLNLTCDELGLNTGLAGKTSAQTSIYKASLNTQLTDDVIISSTTDPMERAGSGENDAKGWYVILEKQGLSPYCDHCEYEATVDSSDGGRDDHAGEKILSKMSLFAGTLYFTTYQPAYNNPCNPQGNAFNYALNYLDGRAALNLNVFNDAASGESPTKKDVTDRYGKHFGVKGLPSGFEIVTRNGQAGALSSIGGAIVGGGEDGYEIPGEDNGISIYYWIER
ncbi:MAG: VWA domain-containing protein [Desulfobacterales bacterium]|nr:MAG: VWA domain-containing protein [Desulfobacterales bacterium]